MELHTFYFSALRIVVVNISMLILHMYVDCTTGLSMPLLQGDPHNVRRRCIINVIESSGTVVMRPSAAMVALYVRRIERTILCLSLSQSMPSPRSSQLPFIP
jgi:hypothetical protein